LVQLGDLDSAIADFTQVLQLNPNHVKAAYARGTCQNLKGDFIEAIGTRTLNINKK
jgi:tetratricopeptide (TPR) repeat protein